MGFLDHNLSRIMNIYLVIFAVEEICQVKNVQL